MRFNESLRSFREFVNYIVINTVIALAIPFFFCASCFLDPQEWTYAGRLWLYSFLISLALSGGIGALDARINRSLPWHKAPLKRFLLELLTVTVYSFVACFVVVFPVNHLVSLATKRVLMTPDPMYSGKFWKF